MLCPEESDNLNYIDRTFSLKTILGIIGKLWMLAGFVILLPLFTLFFFPEEFNMANYFIVPGVMTILIGYLTSLLLSQNRRERLKKNDEAVIVFLGWLSVIFAGSLPFVLSGDYSLSQSVFEAASGFSTTGLSVVNVDNAPKIFLMYRSIMLFFGGIGLILVVTSILPDIYSMRLYTAEGHTDLMMPNLANSVRTVILIYVGYATAGTVLYYLCGMGFFDSLNHSMSAISTGGFSTKSASIGYYDNPKIELVTEILMILGATGFLVHLLLLKGKFRVLFKHCEIMLTILLISLCTPVCAFLMLEEFSGNLSFAVRQSLFQVISALTTTGFQTVSSFENTSPPLMFMFTLLMLIGGGAGSTAGGIKQFRIWIMMKQIWWNIQLKFGDRHIVRINKIERMGVREIISPEYLNEVNVFVVIYLLIFFLGSFVLMLCGHSIGDSMFEFASALGTVGFSAGLASSSAPQVVLWTSTIGMILGRLEIFVILMAAIRIKSGIKKPFRR